MNIKIIYNINLKYIQFNNLKFVLKILKINLLSIYIY